MPEKRGYRPTLTMSVRRLTRSWPPIVGSCLLPAETFRVIQAGSQWFRMTLARVNQKGVLAPSLHHWKALSPSGLKEAPPNL